MTGLTASFLWMALAAAGDVPLALAQKAYSEGDFEAALKQLEAAAGLAASDDTQLGKVHLLRGQCFAAMDDFGKAEAAFSQALEGNAEASLDPARDPPQVVGLLESLRKRLSAELRISADHPKAVLKIDGKSFGALPQRAKVPIGRHTVLVEAEGAAPESKEMVFHPKRVYELSLRLAKAAEKTGTAVNPVGKDASAPAGVGEVKASGVRPFADLRTMIDPGKGLGFEAGAGVSGENLRASLHGTLGAFKGVTVRAGYALPEVASILGVYASADLMFLFVPTVADAPAGGTVAGVGGAAGVEIKATDWLGPFAEASFRYHLALPPALADAPKTAALIGMGLRLRLP